MLKMAGGATLTLGFPGKILAVLQDGTLVVTDHRVPAEKGLSLEWMNTLVQKGEKETWTGRELKSIGMPIGGIATGQLYLCGDGTLGCWELFNQHTYQNEGPYSYAFRPIPKQVQFGFNINAGGRIWQLKHSGFSNITFNGTYPIGTVAYRDPHSPIDVDLVAYSPFIPLVSKDSGLPATIFEIKVTNNSDQMVSVSIDGFLENACAKSAEPHGGQRMRHTKGYSDGDFTCMTHSVDLVENGVGEERKLQRPHLVFADFEGDTYGNWKVEGDAFGPGPAKGTLSNQNPVTGYIGNGLVNTFFKGDGTVGKLTSPEFKIERDYINFKIGGGNQPGKECINLIVGGKIVRTATGRNEETLLWDAWNVSEFNGKTATLQIVDENTGGWSHINIDQITFADKILSKDDYARRNGDINLDAGTMSLILLSSGAADSNPAYGFEHPYVGLVQSSEVTVAGQQSVTLTFALTWHFPHHPQGRHYAEVFTDSEAVAKYVAKEYPRLSRDTKKWRNTYYDSTLPYWLLDRLHMTAANLATGVTEWRRNDLFWCWEGVVCCDGTCTHVWNYEHTLARLFPDLERNIRVKTDFGVGFDENTGLVGMRSDREYAADGQCGTILKAYREHQVSADSVFLKDNWPKIKKALEFLIKHDGNGDGILEDAQPNTYDIEFFGANTFVGSLYLGALRAGEEMAKELGDDEFALTCKTIFEKGSDATMKRLWNGEYFIQEVDESRYKQYQYGPGCLADQLFGQGWAHQVNLGYLYPEDKVKKGLQSVWKYNWAPDVERQNKRWPPQRPFALAGEAGLFTCTWPIGGREKDPVLYRDEIWTGIEYQVAGNMIWEGLVDEGLSICRAVHERYHPSKRNPYNEVECSDHYARAMASWGVFLALAGFRYHGPKGYIGFAPRLKPEHFKSAFTAAEGWGTFEQKVTGYQQTADIAVTWGRLNLREIYLESDIIGTIKVFLGKKELQASAKRYGRGVTITLDKPLILKEKQAIHVQIGLDHPA